MAPTFIDAYMAPVRDNPIVQVMLFGVLILILADMVFGIANACLHHEFSSKKLREGLTHKMGELVIVIVGVVIDGLVIAGVDFTAFGIPQPSNGPVLMVILGSFILMEVGSLMEIAAKMNPQFEELKAFKVLASVKDGGKHVA